MEIVIDEQSVLPLRAAEAVSRIIKNRPDVPFLLLFSGGSAQAIIEHIDAQVINERITLSVLDERFGVAETDSNFAQLEATDFCRAAQSRGAGVIDPRGIEGEESLSEAAGWFAGALRAWRVANPEGLIIITQGLGEDGHTAGVLPMPQQADRFQELFLDTGQWAVGYEVTPDVNKFTQRITVSLSFLRDAVTSSVLYAPGENKRPALEAALNQPDEPLAAVPGRIVHQMNDVVVLTDQSIDR